jgi:hypothetical protein
LVCKKLTYVYGSGPDIAICIGSTKAKFIHKKDNIEKFHDLKNGAFSLQLWRHILEVGNSSWSTPKD